MLHHEVKQENNLTWAVLDDDGVVLFRIQREPINPYWYGYWPDGEKIEAYGPEQTAFDLYAEMRDDCRLDLTGCEI